MLRILLQVPIGIFMFLMKVMKLEYYLLSDNWYSVEFVVVGSMFLVMKMMRWKI